MKTIVTLTEKGNELWNNVTEKIEEAVVCSKKPLGEYTEEDLLATIVVEIESDEGCAVLELEDPENLEEASDAYQRLKKLELIECLKHGSCDLCKCDKLAEAWCPFKKLVDGGILRKAFKLGIEQGYVELERR